MDILALLESHLFHGLTEAEIQDALARTPHTVQRFEKDAPVFSLMDTADRLGVILQGRVQAQKIFPGGSQVNVSIRGMGDLIGPAAAFSMQRRYPCELIALEPSEILMFRRDDMVSLLQSDGRIMANFLSELASATYLLQQRLELLSYSAIHQKIAFYLMMHHMQTGSKRVPVPESMTKWALMMNVSRPSLHRELKKLEEQGLVNYAPPMIEILDTDALQAML